MRCLFLVMCLMHAATVGAANRYFGDWVVSVDGGFYETYTANDSGSTLGLLCSVDVCSFYLRTGMSCEAGGSYTVLINSELGASTQKISCFPMTMKGSQEYALLIGDIESFTNIVLGSSTVGIAVPMSNGQFKVSRFSLRGAGQALDAIVKARKTGANSTPSQPRRQGIHDLTL